MTATCVNVSRTLHRGSLDGAGQTAPGSGDGRLDGGHLGSIPSGTRRRRSRGDALRRRRPQWRDTDPGSASGRARSSPGTARVASRLIAELISLEVGTRPTSPEGAGSAGRWRRSRGVCRRRHHRKFPWERRRNSVVVREGLPASSRATPPTGTTAPPTLAGQGRRAPARQHRRRRAAQPTHRSRRSPRGRDRSGRSALPVQSSAAAAQPWGSRSRADSRGSVHSPARPRSGARIAALAAANVTRIEPRAGGQLPETLILKDADLERAGGPARPRLPELGPDLLRVDAWLFRGLKPRDRDRGALGPSGCGGHPLEETTRLGPPGPRRSSVRARHIDRGAGIARLVTGGSAAARRTR